MPTELWIGLFEAEICDCNPEFGDAKYAAVNAVAMASSEQEFAARVRSALQNLGLQCVAFEDIERYEFRVSACTVDSSIQDAATLALTTGQVAFGTFHITNEESSEESRYVPRTQLRFPHRGLR